MSCRCPVGRAGLQVAEAVDREIGKGTRLKEIARLSGIPLSTVWRHKHHCIARQVLEENRQRKNSHKAARRIVQEDPKTGELLVTLEYDSRNFPFFGRDGKESYKIARSELRSTDVVIRIVYAPPPKPRSKRVPLFEGTSEELPQDTPEDSVNVMPE